MERYSKKFSSKWQSHYSNEFKQHVCQDFITGTLTRTAVERKYKIGNSRLSCWLLEFGYQFNKPTPLPLLLMPDTAQNNEKDKSVIKLKKELEDAKLLIEAYKSMIEKAEQDLNISIRKKSSTK